jgi:hypothetical protein
MTFTHTANRGTASIKATPGTYIDVTPTANINVGDTASMKGGDIGIPMTVDNTDYQYTGVRVVDG